MSAVEVHVGDADGARDRQLGDRSLELLVATLVWRAEARCRDVPTAVFYPVRGDSVLVEVAKRICTGCPVKEECLRYAIEAGEVLGVWGGASAHDRREMRAEVRLANGTPAV
jgi:WhiB family redox-sensing transcriptional regulator